jgi:diketogulonate reductase-like aldo/keto reductase
VIRWAVQRGTSVIPKSSTASRIAQNFDVQAWTLSAEDMNKLNSVEPQDRIVKGDFFVSPNGPYKTLAEVWDE